MVDATVSVSVLDGKSLLPFDEKLVKPDAVTPLGRPLTLKEPFTFPLVPLSDVTL